MSHQIDLKRLIAQYNRRLQKLREKEAQYGLETPVSTLTEIEDIEAKIKEFQEELAQANQQQDLEITPDPIHTPNDSTSNIGRSKVWIAQIRSVSIAILLIGLIGGVVLLFWGDSLTSKNTHFPAHPTPTISAENAVKKYFALVNEALALSDQTEKRDKFKRAFQMLSSEFVKVTVSQDPAYKDIESDFDKYQYGWEHELGAPHMSNLTVEYTNLGNAFVTIDLSFSLLDGTYRIRYDLTRNENEGHPQFDYWLITGSKFVQ